MAADLGTGNGIIPFILSHKNKDAKFIGVELQKSSVQMAERSCELNKLQSRVEFFKRIFQNLIKAYILIKI